MRIGIPKEIKHGEKRVSVTPASVREFRAAGHEVIIETGAGEGSGFTDPHYRDAGAAVALTAAEVWSADMVVKVKEPLREEFQYFRRGLVLFTYLHLAPEPELTQALVDSGVTAIAYETVQAENGSLPLLMPMSEVAGRMSVQLGARYLENAGGGRGILLGGIPGTEPARVAIIGGGVVGANAARIAVGCGADVTVLDINAERLRGLDDQYRGRLKTLLSNAETIGEAVRRSDLVIGAVLIPGARAPRLVTEEMVKQMRPGSVIIDVAIDQGGSIETIDRITTHDDPTYEKHGVIHYAVANIPGSVARTSTMALAGVTTPYSLFIAGKGVRRAALEHSAIAKGVNVYDGRITYPAVAEAFGAPCTDLRHAMAE